jgi:TonB family protein
MERLVLEFVLRSSLIILTAALVLRALRIRAAAAQHALWVGVLALMLALPFWITWGPKASLAVLPASATASATTRSPMPADRVVTIAVPLELSEPASDSTIRNESAVHWSWKAFLFGAYLLGAGALLLRLAIGTTRANQLTSLSCAAPVTVGLLHPRVILPECSREWSRAQFDAVLAHEQAHVRRRDPLVLWLALLNRAVFWFHPLAWWLERRITALAEEACDAAVIERGHAPRDYSEYLLDVARAVQRAGARVNVTAMAMPGTNLTSRIRRLIAGISASRVSRVRMAGAVFACAISSVMFAAGSLEHVARLDFPPIAPPQMRAPVYKLFPETAAVRVDPVWKPRLLLAQATPGSPVVATPAPMPTFLSNVMLVIADVTVSDKNGNSVEGLRANDFVVTEDGVTQTISVFEFQKAAVINGIQSTVSSYYVLGYYTTNPNADSKFRRIEIIGKTDAIAKLEHRMGYYAKMPNIAGGARGDADVRLVPDGAFPVLIHKYEPEYSEAARKAKWQGTVALSVEVNASGDATNVRVIHSLGLGLDEEAVEAVGRWKFKPGVKDGKPVALQAEVVVNFRLP